MSLIERLRLIETRVVFELENDDILNIDFYGD